MDEPVLLTIAIPTYNRRASVVALVEAIKYQLVPGDDLLVVDDGSQDGTAEALREIRPVRLLHHSSNQGMVKTWNACLSSALRDWICLIHDDDLIAPDALAVIRQGCAAARGPALVAHQNAGAKPDGDFRYRVIDPGSEAALNAPPIPSGVAIHKDIVHSLGLFDERFTYSADMEYFARIGAQYKFVIIESPQVLQYVIHDENYQFKTWHQPDFVAQLEEIEKLVVAYAGLSVAAAAQELRARMISYLNYIFRGAVRLGDKSLVRKIARALQTSPYFGRRTRLKGRLAAVLGWWPVAE